MTHRRDHALVVCALSAVAGVVLLAPASASGQNRDAAADQWTLPRTGDGRPDLQGVWDFRSLTPLQRPSDLADTELFTDEEAAQFQLETVAQLDKDRAGPDGRIPLSGGYNEFWYDYGKQLTAGRRTSLIVDPSDGRIPSLTPDARTRADARRTALGRPAWGPEDRGAYERCIAGFNAGPPMNPSAYNNNMQLFQTADYVVILNEMVHDARVIPLDDRSHLPTHVRQWHGDSRGHWDGDTLVVDTRNYTDKTNFRGSGQHVHLVERFTRVGANTLLYEYTIEDPASFGGHWSAAIPMMKNDAPLYEYACHEGNYGMHNLLVSARSDDETAAANPPAC